MNTYRPKGEEEVVEAHLEERVTAFPDQGHCGRESVSRHLWRGSRGRQRTEGHTPCPHAPSQLSFSSVCLWREQVQAWGGRIGDVKWSLKCCLRFCTRYLSFKLKLRNFYFLQMSDHKILDLPKYSVKVREDYLNWVNSEAKVRDTIVTVITIHVFCFLDIPSLHPWHKCVFFLR